MRKSVTLFITGILLCISSVNAEIERVSVSTIGEQGNNNSRYPVLSDDGNIVAFTSYSSNLVQGNSTGGNQIFVHNRDTGVTERIQFSLTSELIHVDSNNSIAISASGRFIGFYGYTGQFVSYDVFIHDRDLNITERVNVSTSGAPGTNASSITPARLAISPDGRFVAFTSNATNLVEGDSNNTFDVFVRDRVAGITERVSVSSNDAQADKLSRLPSISNDGRYVTFVSGASNLVQGDTNGGNDVFVFDRELKQAERVSVSSSGAQGNGAAGTPYINGDGRYVVFHSSSSNLVGNDTNGVIDVFIYDLELGKTELVSVSSQGEQGNSNSSDSTISRDGRFVVFGSNASNLVAGDTAGNTLFPNYSDVFVHDLLSGITKRVSVSSDGIQGVSTSRNSSISSDGSFVAFHSSARNLVPGDTNSADDVYVTENNLDMFGDQLSVSVEPTSGSTEVGNYIRFRASLKNNGITDLSNCNALIVNPLVDGRRQYSFYSWPLNIANPALNATVDIAPGGTAQINLAVLPRVALRNEITFEYSCDSTHAFTIPYINTVHLNAKTEPLISEDFIQLKNGNNKTDLLVDRGNGKYWTPFVMMIRNTGSEFTSANLTTTSYLADAVLRPSVLCEPVDPANGNWSCNTPRDTHLQVDLAAGETKRVLVFVHARQTINKKPAANRIHIEAHDSAGDIVAKTSMGISTTN